MKDWEEEQKLDWLYICHVCEFKTESYDVMKSHMITNHVDWIYNAEQKLMDLAFVVKKS